MLKKQINIFISLFLLFFFSNFSYSFTQKHANSIALLPDGNFLSCGGQAYDKNTHTWYRLNTCELYDTSKSAYTAFANLNVYRSSAAITVLSDGRVLITGGYGGANSSSNNILQTAELYVSTVAVPFWKTLNMTMPRAGHTATLIAKGTYAGKVLICGGQTNTSNITNTCEVFDPGTEQFTSLSATMNSKRFAHTATVMPNEKILISGGMQDLSFSSRSYLVTQEIFDSAISSFTPVDSLLAARAYHNAVTLNNGNTLIIGGYHYFDYVENYERDSTSLDPRGPAYDDGEKDVQNDQHQGTQGYLETMEIFDTNGRRVKINASDYVAMPYRVSKSASVLFPDGTVIISGGYGNIPVNYIPQPQFTVAGGSFVRVDTSPDEQYSYISTYTLSNITLTGVETQLNRQVKGRIIDGDIFFPPGNPKMPQISIGNATIHFISASTATLDAKEIKCDISGNCGILDLLNDTLTLNEPVFTSTTSSRVTWEDVPISEINVATISGTVNFPTLPKDGVGYLSTPSRINMYIKFLLDPIYSGYKVKGTLSLKGVGITDDQSNWTITFSVSAQFDWTTVDSNGFLAVNISNVEIGNMPPSNIIENKTAGDLTGPVTISTSDTVDMNFLEVKDMKSNGFNLTSSGINPVFVIGKSTAVIREMIFANNFKFHPNSGYIENDNPLSSPRFDHSALLTPGNDILNTVGLNCEKLDINAGRDPQVDCLRTKKFFTPLSNTDVLIPRNPNLAKGKSMIQKRANHTSTVLPGNKILTCGGTDGAITLISCEMYDPSLDKWVFVSSMSVPRAYHTATLLPNGNVLIAGGMRSTEDNSIDNTAEIFFSDSNRIVPTGNKLNIARAHHTATLLSDGNVMLIGGVTNGGYPDYAEIYKNTIDKWELLTNPGDNIAANHRQEHTTTFLKSNRVLIAGGVDGTGVLSSACIYDMTTSTFTCSGIPLMNRPRKGHTATLLKDGRVFVTGGSDGLQLLDNFEWYDEKTNSWTMPTNIAGYPKVMSTPRAYHKAILLPNGKVLISGGEGIGSNAKNLEIYDTDFATFTYYDTSKYARQRHTMTIDSVGNVYLIGGYDGGNVLDATEFRYFSFSPDKEGLTTAIQRQPVISTATLFFDRGDKITLLSNVANFHGLSEASSGLSGGKNSSHSNPRVYLNAVDNPSSFLVDLTTRIYSAYGSSNKDWNLMRSSISISVPSNPGELPYGWYYLYAEDNAQFSEGYLVQVTTPRPKGAVSNIRYISKSTNTVLWKWDSASLSDGADGYAIFSSSDNVFLSTSAINDTTYLQRTNEANSPASIKIIEYNVGGYALQLAQSPTYYTYANPPVNLTINKSDFGSIDLSWEKNGNSDLTTYEVLMVEYPDFTSDPEFTTNVSTPISFDYHYTLTTATIYGLNPAVYYYFKVRAQNGNAEKTAFSNITSTITISAISNLTGTAISLSTISWSWENANGATGYSIYDISNGTATKIWISSTVSNNFIQENVSINNYTRIGVLAFKGLANGATIYGPITYSDYVYTLSAPPVPISPNPYIMVDTKTLAIKWDANGNPLNTEYVVEYSSYSDFVYMSSYTVKDTSFTITDLMPNRAYYVRGYSMNHNGVHSATVYFPPIPKYTKAQAPQNVRAVDITLSRISLTWDTVENSTDTIYQVEISTDKNMSAASIPLGASFSDKMTTNYIDINGLWTNTTYYITVSAENKEGKDTAKIFCVPNPVTLSGPKGAPSMSIGGRSDPTKKVIIDGYLPPDEYSLFPADPTKGRPAGKGRRVTLTIPPETFDKPVQIAISTGSICSWKVDNTHCISFNIYSEAEPKIPVKFQFDYTEDEAYDTTHSGIYGIDQNRKKIILARYDDTTDRHVPLQTEIDQSNRTISSYLNHFSNFQVMVYEPKSDLNNVNIFPNPYYPNKNQGYITISDMPSDSKITIYTLTGDKVFETNANGAGNAYWDGKNQKGSYVGSGIYLCLVKSSYGKKVFKIAIER